MVSNVDNIPISHHFKSSVWFGIHQHMDTIIDNSRSIVGTGDNITIWTDNWLGSTLMDHLVLPNSLTPSLLGKLSSFVLHGQRGLMQFLIFLWLLIGLFKLFYWLPCFLTC